MPPLTIFALAMFFTYFCTAVNCYTYRIAYPLWGWVGPAEFGALHREYLRRLTPVITVPHVAMFFTTGTLLLRRPAWFSSLKAEWVFALGTMVILLSAGVAGPVHDRFGRNGMVDERGMRVLLGVSAVRVVLMLAACAVLAWGMVGR